MAATIALEMERGRGHWDRDAMARVRALLPRMRPAQSTEIFQLAGFEPKTARTLARIFGRGDAYYRYTVDERTLLTLSFLRVGTADWELTQESRDNLDLPFHPKLPSPLTPPPSLGAAKGRYEKCDAIGAHTFASGERSYALRCTLELRGHRLTLTTSEDLLRDDWTFADRIDAALSNIPAAHLALVREIVLDPGEHPTVKANATTSWDGKRVNMFLSGAGKRVAQERLDGTTAHEFGHVVSLQQGESLWTRWDAAIVADKRGVSAYGLTNRVEDFAEAYELYLGGGSRDRETRARYPRRFAILDSLF